MYVCMHACRHLFESHHDENRLHPQNWIVRKGPGVLGPTKSRLGSNLAVRP